MNLIERAVGKANRSETEAGPTSPAEERAAVVKESSIQRAAALAQEEVLRTERRKIPADNLTGQKEPALDPAEAPQGIINLARLKQAGMITPDLERNQIAEEFRGIKRPILTNAFGRGANPIRNGNLVMVTSSLPGEGKSFCAVNLAISIALERDHTVLLVDADVAKPSIPEYLGIKGERGLMDLLIDDKLQLSDVLIRTNVDKLTILPAGPGHRYATELLASGAMNRLLDELAQRYPERIIIFDSPPLLATSEARVLAGRMGQIILVVESEKTTQEVVQEALKQLEGCDVVGVVLNKTRRKPGGDLYGYYGMSTS